MPGGCARHTPAPVNSTAVTVMMVLYMSPFPPLRLHTIALALRARPRLSQIEINDARAKLPSHVRCIDPSESLALKPTRRAVISCQIRRYTATDLRCSIHGHHAFDHRHSSRLPRNHHVAWQGRNGRGVSCGGSETEA